MNVNSANKIRLYGFVRIKSFYFVEIVIKMYIKVEIEYHIENNPYHHLIATKNVKKPIIKKILFFIIVYCVNNQNVKNVLMILYIRK
jgi:hypothetical protein